MDRSNFYALFDTFHFITFTSLAQFLKNNYKYSPKLTYFILFSPNLNRTTMIALIWPLTEEERKTEFYQSQFSWPISEISAITTKTSVISTVPLQKDHWIIKFHTLFCSQSEHKPLLVLWNKCNSQATHNFESFNKIERHCTLNLTLCTKTRLVSKDLTGIIEE